MYLLFSYSLQLYEHCRNDRAKTGILNMLWIQIFMKLHLRIIATLGIGPSNCT